MNAIIFDFDATLYAEEELIIHLIEERTNVFLHKHGVKDIRLLEESIPNIVEALDVLSLDRTQYLTEVFENIQYENYFKENKQLIKRLCELPCLKIIVSLSPYKYVVAALKQMGLICYFDKVLSVWDFPYIHSKKSIYHAILKEHNLLAIDVICIGNSYSLDLVPALTLGIKGILICSKDSVREKHLEIQSFTDINSCLYFLKCSSLIDVNKK